MGDRGNIAIKQDDGSDIFFYTHWRGSELPEILQQGLKEGLARWNDAPYLARIIFDNLTDGERGETGFGISNTIGDNEHQILEVDCGNQRVNVCNEARQQLGPVITSWTFEEFIKAGPADLANGIAK